MTFITCVAVSTFILIFLALSLNTARYSSKQKMASNGEPIAVMDREPAVEHLSKAIQFKTISYENPNKNDADQFLNFRQFLQTSYPDLHNKLTLDIIGEYSLLYTWQGSKPGLEPVIFLAHQDVVPVEPETKESWTYDAFSGKVNEGFIWGRGTIDDKGCLIALMEAVEALIRMDFTPRRTVYLAFGHDEEVGGQQGAKKIAEYLKRKGAKISFAIDEGLTILEKDLSPAKRKTALIGVSEKGNVTLRITANSVGGHSSMPNRKTSIGILARAIKLLEANQMPVNFHGPAAQLFDYIGPEMTLPNKFVLANLWLFKSLVTLGLQKVNTTNAMVRTTCAPTVIEGGEKVNILPSQATVYVNYRILPGDTISSVLDHTRTIINDPDVDISIHRGAFDTDPSLISSVDAVGFKAIWQTISEVFQNVIVAPGLVLGATDSRHYKRICRNIYRFVPYRLGRADVSRIHGVDERISIEDYIKLIQFYVQLIRNFDHEKKSQL